MGMKYYAKSKKKGLSDKERGKQIKEPEEEQKTLNSHQEDIVRCAEAFFEEYGRLIFPVDSSYYSGDTLGELEPAVFMIGGRRIWSFRQ